MAKKQKESKPLNVFLNPTQVQGILNVIDVAIRSQNSNVDALAAFKFQLHDVFLKYGLMKINNPPIESPKK